MSQLPAAEANEHLDLIAVFHKPFGLLDFGVEIVHIDIKPQLNLFELDNFLAFSSLFFPLGLLKPVLSIIHDFADRRFGIRCDFYQIGVALRSLFQRRFDRHNAKLAAV